MAVPQLRTCSCKTPVSSPVAIKLAKTRRKSKSFNQRRKLAAATAFTTLFYWDCLVLLIVQLCRYNCTASLHLPLLLSFLHALRMISPQQHGLAFFQCKIICRRRRHQAASARLTAVLGQMNVCIEVRKVCSFAVCMHVCLSVRVCLCVYLHCSRVCYLFVRLTYFFCRPVSPTVSVT